MDTRDRKSIKLGWSISLGILIIVFGATFSTRATPTIAWQPPKIASTVSAGGSKTIVANFVAMEDVTDASVRVVPALQPFVRVEPQTIDSIKKGQPVQVILTIEPPATMLPGIVEGAVQIRAGNPASTVSRPLPVAIMVSWARFSNTQAGVQFIYPDFGIAAKVDVTTGVAGGTMLDVKYQSPPGTNFVSAFGILLLPNTNQLTLAEWFHQTIDQNEVLISAGTFTGSNTYGMDALVRSGPIPDVEIDNGPVADIYALSASHNTIIVISSSQTSELDIMGLTAVQKNEILRQVLVNLQTP
jgi:hypothetical protein